ncbi:MAG: hypothetical protein ACREKN_07700 [Longimicrobiaceae bacterium]
MTESEAPARKEAGAEESRRRVRFVEATYRPDPRSVSAAVSLEWNGRQAGGEAVAPAGVAAELRVPALATLRALEKLMDGKLRFELVGIKSTRAFDADLVVVLIHCPNHPERRLVGVCLNSGKSVAESAALAVLNATNRVLGNYLDTSD